MGGNFRAMSSEDERVLEKGLSLSDSMIWSLMRRFYEHRGAQAWTDGSVPFHITNTPRLAHTWAKLVAGYLRDLDHAGKIDREKPLYLMEIGAGSGRHAFLLLRALQYLEQFPVFHGLKWCVILADLAQSNLDTYREHTHFAPFFNQRQLDLALFDAECEQSIKLQVSGQELRPEDFVNPLIVMGNYLLDSLTQDAFRVDSGTLYESTPLITAPKKKKLDMEDPLLIKKLDVKYQQKEIEGERYENETWNSILEEYRTSLGDTGFGFPVGALSLFGNLIELSGKRMLFLCADKAYNRLEELTQLEDPEPVAHGGGFSMMVNGHALECYVNRLGGRALHSTQRDLVLEISAYLVDQQVEQCPELGLAFETAVEEFGPADFFSLKERVNSELKRPTLRLCVDLLRLSQWDPQTLYDLSEPILSQLEGADPVLLKELRGALRQIWVNFFPLGDETDVPFEFGRIYYRMEHYQRAIEFYEISLEYYGQHKMTLHNIGLCNYYLADFSRAASYFEEALDLDPDYGPAREWSLKVRGEERSVKGLDRPLFASAEFPVVQ